MGVVCVLELIFEKLAPMLLDLLDGGSSGAAVQQEESASPSTVVQPMLDSSG